MPLSSIKWMSYCPNLLFAGTILSQIRDIYMPSSSPRLLDWKQLQSYLPPRVRDAHKGLYGHVLVVGGDYGMGGAVRLAAEAALRVGAGLVSVATRPEHVTTVNACRPEILCHQISQATDLGPLLARASVVVAGPGMGQSDWSKSLFNKILSAKLPLILDADALNLLSQQPQAVPNAVLTPHPGEAARLLGVSTESVQAERAVATHRLVEKYHSVVVLKGAGTLVQSAQGLAICKAGNPGMATAGMGDVLAGVIGGLVAQGLAISIAAELGVYVHALAADQAAFEGGQRGLLACDLMKYLRALVNPDERDA